MKTSRLKYNTFLILSLLLVYLVFLSFTFLSGSVPEKLVIAFNNGNYKEISNFLNDDVELDIMDQEGIYGKMQAEQILKLFFQKNKPLKFSILHEGGKEKTWYVIGQLKTSNENFRINFLFKSNIILQLRIESDNGN